MVAGGDPSLHLYLCQRWHQLGLISNATDADAKVNDLVMATPPGDPRLFVVGCVQDFPIANGNVHTADGQKALPVVNFHI